MIGSILKQEQGEKLALSLYDFKTNNTKTLQEYLECLISCYCPLYHFSLIYYCLLYYALDRVDGQHYSYHIQRKRHVSHYPSCITLPIREILSVYMRNLRATFYRI